MFALGKFLGIFGNKLKVLLLINFLFEGEAGVLDNIVVESYILGKIENYYFYLQRKYNLGIGKLRSLIYSNKREDLLGFISEDKNKKINSKFFHFILKRLN